MKKMSRTLAFVSFAALLVVGCNNSTGSNGAPSAATSTLGATNRNTPKDAGGGLATGPLRCAPSEGMLDACSGKASGDGCALFGKRDGGWSLPGSCRSTFDGSGLACVPTPPGPPSFLVNACSGKASGGACTVTAPSGRTFDGTCVTGRASTTLFCGRAHSPPEALLDACSGKAAGDACSRPEHRDGGSKPGVCRTGTAGALACRPAAFAGTEACAGLDAGATCTFGFGHKHGEEGLSGSCVAPASGGAATCLVSCTELFHRRHHRHGLGPGRGGPGGRHGGPWWQHGAADAGTPSP
jgi:hypothetical protein